MTATLSLWVDECLNDSRASIEQVVSLELDRAVSLAADPNSATPGERAAVACRGAVLVLSYQRAGAERQRALEVRGISDQALARTVGLALVELIEAPQVEAPQSVKPSRHARPAVASPRSRTAAVTQASVLGTARVFLATSDLTLGARLRSRFLPEQRHALLLGFGGETGSAARAPGNVSVTAAYAELGVGYDLWRSAWLTVAVEALGEAGYVVLRGQPRVMANTAGERLTGAWGDLQVSLSPRLRLTRGVELTSRVGLGIMLLAPAPTSDSQPLNVWRGVNASADLGLAVSL